jgi:YtkA-like protein
MTRAVGIAAITALACAGVAAAGPGRVVVSQHGSFRAVIQRPDPVPVEQLHSWRVRLTARNGRPVVHARIGIWGDMPAHGHGLPTQPRARELGGGRYSLDGMKFQMGGAWVVELRIATGKVRDVVRLRFTIPGP